MALNVASYRARAFSSAAALWVAVGVVAACNISDPAGETPLGPHSIQIVRGNDQVASPGTAVPVAPAAAIRDSAGNALTGVEVVFTVLEGGGTVTDSAAISDSSDGIATVGSWTLGTAPGINRLRASTADSSVVFTALAGSQSPLVTFGVVGVPSVAGDTLELRVRIESENQLASVSAWVGDATTELTAVGSGYWEGNIDLSGKPYGTLTVQMRATDVLGNATDLIETFDHDRKPTLEVSFPVEEEVVRPDVRVAASCSDDGPSQCTIRAGAHASDGGESVLVDWRAPPVDATASLAQFDGDMVEVRITAADSRNQWTQTVRNIYVVTSPRLALMASGNGHALDVSESRMLLERSVGTWGDGGCCSTMVIRDLPTGQEDSLATQFGSGVQQGFLTRAGAVFRRNSVLYDWRGASTEEIANVSLLDVSGDHAVYIRLTQSNVGSVYRRDLTTGSDILISTSVYPHSAAVASNGDIAYIRDDDIFHYHDGTSTRLTTDGAQVDYVVLGMDDGMIAYGRRESVSDEYDVLLSDGSTTTAVPEARSFNPKVFLDSGWTAFIRTDNSLVDQVWTRSPAGDLRQVSALGSDARIDAIGADGSIVFRAAQSRYLAGPTGPAAQIGPAFGSGIWRDGRFVVLIGRSAFTIAP